MSAPVLKEALQLVETLGLAPLARISNTMPRNYVGEAYRRWDARRREVEDQVAAKLREQGAIVTVRSDATRIHFAGVGASSTMGLQQALRNWKTAAEKGLKHWGNRQ